MATEIVKLPNAVNAHKYKYMPQSQMWGTMILATPRDELTISITPVDRHGIIDFGKDCCTPHIALKVTTADQATGTLVAVVQSAKPPFNVLTSAHDVAKLIHDLVKLNWYSKNQGSLEFDVEMVYYTEAGIHTEAFRHLGSEFLFFPELFPLDIAPEF